MLFSKSNNFLQTALSNKLCFVDYIKLKNVFRAYRFNQGFYSNKPPIKSWTRFLGEWTVGDPRAYRWITSLTSAPVNISKELKLKDGSSWQLCCAAVLDDARPQKNSRTEQLKKLIEKFSLQ